MAVTDRHIGRIESKKHWIRWLESFDRVIVLGFLVEICPLASRLSNAAGNVAALFTDLDVDRKGFITLQDRNLPDRSSREVLKLCGLPMFGRCPFTKVGLDPYQLASSVHTPRLEATF